MTMIIIIIIIKIIIMTMPDADKDDKVLEIIGSKKTKIAWGIDGKNTQTK